MPEVRMPKMGDSMEEGTILRWIKHEGDTVAMDEFIAEVETDKANVEIPAEEGGTLTKIVVQEGETVPVGAVIAVIGDGAGPSAGSAKDKAAAPPEKAGNGQTAESASRVPPELPPAEDFMREVRGAPPEERLKASPVARKIAESLGIDLALVRGTGPGGRIVERDVRAFHESGKSTPSPAMPRMPAQSRASVRQAVGEKQSGDQDVEISRMRKAIARRTAQSKQTVPHFYLVMPADMERALGVLDDMNTSTPKQKVTINDLIIKACAVALKAMPDVNVSFTDQERVRRYSGINIGIAVGTDDGLTVPVIPDCGSKTLRQISTEARALIDKARKGGLTPQDMSGGTFSISNLGMFGVEEFAAIINPPESAILAIGAVLAEVMVDEFGQFVSHRRMHMTLSCDHRTVDGLLGAKFLQEIRRLLENPFELLA